jgi:hypothetical protein
MRLRGSAAFFFSSADMGQSLFQSAIFSRGFE